MAATLIWRKTLEAGIDFGHGVSTQPCDNEKSDPMLENAMRTANAAVLTFLLVSPLSVLAGEGSPGEGKKLARELCAKCHVIEKYEPKTTKVPSFSEIAASEHNAQSLRVFLRTPHATMPSIVLTDRQRDDVAAYIASLRED